MKIGLGKGMFWTRNLQKTLQKNVEYPLKQSTHILQSSILENQGEVMAEYPKVDYKKMFLDTKWGHPFEQTWMSHIFQETTKGNIKPAVLLASPVWHNRIVYYNPEERREN